MKTQSRNRLLALGLLAGLGVTPAALADNDIGCGLGTILWEGRSGALAKTLAATTNAATGSQTLGVSSGTSQCQQGGVITVAQRLPVFVGANFDRLAANMAAGEGEALTTLAVLYGIQPRLRPRFYALAQASYGRLFAGKHVTAGRMLRRLDAVVAADPLLEKVSG